MKNGLLATFFVLPTLGAFGQQVSLPGSRLNDTIAKIDAAIKADPMNKTLYYREGMVYEQAAAIEEDTLKKLEKAAKPGVKPDPQIAKLRQTLDELYSNAAGAYERALGLDPTYFEAVLELGRVTMLPCIDLYNEAVQLPADQEKAYDRIMGEAQVQFKLAKPYVVKAVELNPKSLEALTNLELFYHDTFDIAGVIATEKKIKALHAQH